jgi:uncharacterized protein involved in exopolysaccharide biosynthesis
LAELSDAEGAMAQQAGRFGDENPMYIASRQRVSAVNARLQDSVAEVGLGVDGRALRAAIAIGTTHKSELIKQIVGSEAVIKGRQKELEVLETEFQRQGSTVKRMSADLARLEDLKKDHLVAEAVFTSALARLDTNKADIYASYPMVQFLAEPDLPERPASPHIGLAFAGGILATLLALAGWSMAWLRRTFIRKH